MIEKITTGRIGLKMLPSCEVGMSLVGLSNKFSSRFLKFQKRQSIEIQKQKAFINYQSNFRKGMIRQYYVYVCANIAHLFMC